MSYNSPKHLAKHSRVRWGDTSYAYQVSATTTEPMPYSSNHKPRHSNVDYGYNNVYEDKRTLEIPKAQIIESEYYNPQHVKTSENYQVKEDVNQEAEDFIALEHKKFARLSTWM
ncbi:hypothetical protein ERO13_A03G134215v2 [Gossypium hirsutum]|uniref:Uncharacterized protein n=5 Tax=Gossypium TaxID=3633 RepID=A0ABR0QHK3_GOSAR|nr:hypothetical protein ES319_A03G147000v1 [Gossypium barbadense]KAG4208475.1 hypothetical protein ERO13_A03G134215v2 [Gossypium hirsutum]KAK5838794.1 hypothetical protein PVK06_007532 [Gossypium arboreum]TYH25404.1 hypothetical protein ES288_A03G165900v1 [Gossypium darwinii]TYJ43396.1 hypothetical protein E1A91_A03G150100v1 [Gossypium mustelinum]